MKIFVFGIGQYFKNRKKQFFEISSDDTLMAFLDNRACELEECEGIPVLPPSVVVKAKFDKIVLMSTYYQEIFKQLLSLGVQRNKIVFWEQYRAEKTRGKIQLQIQTPFSAKMGKIMIISTDLGYNGGSVAVISLAIALANKGYNIYLATSNCDDKMREELNIYNINLLIYPALPYLTDLEKKYIKKFDIIIVNVFQMIKVACDISQYKPVLWWIHESNGDDESVYGYIRYQFSEYDYIRRMEKIRVYAVSDVARNAFEKYYPNQVFDLLPFGIADKSGYNIMQKKCCKFVFAIIGSISRLKAQLDFLKAANMLPRNIKSVCEFWIIGACREDGYANEVRNFAQNVPNVKFLGIMKRKELSESFSQIDCVVCASMVETMSLAIVEGMMHGKICITTDKTGIAAYMKDGVNGFVYRAGDITLLHDCMKKTFDMRNNSYEIRKNARKLYEDEFSMERFGERLEHALSETEKYYHERYANE